MVVTAWKIEVVAWTYGPVRAYFCTELALEIPQKWEGPRERKLGD